MSTPHEPQSRIRFAEDTKQPAEKQQPVLHLTPISHSSTNRLNYSILTTPGGAGTPFTNLLRGVVGSNHGRSSDSGRVDSPPPRSDDTALSFARSAPVSGYLRKLGTNIPTFKRRFFVLKPSTHLYYFMSPTDVEPRGCIDLDGGEDRCDVREIGVLPDGTFRFELVLDGAEDVQKQSVVLEARTEEMGREWMRKLQNERLSTARDEIDGMKQSLAEIKATSARWEQMVQKEQLRANEAEKRLNLAHSEAKAWEGKFHDLNQAVSVLETHITDARTDSMLPSVERLDLNDTNFPTLCQAIQTIHQDYTLACETAEEERRRAKELQQQLQDMEIRLSKAHAEASTLWQEHCAIQRELKKCKREKKVLIQEVRAQRAKASDESDQNQASLPPESSCASTEQSQKQVRNESLQRNTEQQRLVIELEEHVMSGLRLSEQFLTLNGIEPSVVDDEMDSCDPTNASPEKNRNHHPLHSSGVPTKLSSLLDDDSHDATTMNDEEDSVTNHDSISVHKSNSQPIAEAQVPEDPKETTLVVNQNLNDRFSEMSPSPKRKETSNGQVPPPSSGAKLSISGSSKVTETGHATSKLECLKGIGDAPRLHPPGCDLRDEIYHITFYSAKIGLQFQKVPIEKASVGLLTDAMTADNEANRTTSDLLRIAAISHISRETSKSSKLPMECTPVPPVDMVLVCGFVGFDESTGNTRPQIGARLVAFDGITVEVGKWTFESIRKSIQARGRPLTLSFRNESLNPKQQMILTKAVNDVKARDEPTPISKTIFRRSHREKALERNSSIISKTSSVSSNSHKYYSFSEAGSTISSAVAPLMSNLMTGLSAGKKRQEEFTPDYLRRQSSSLDEMRHHHDFKSSLL